MKISLALFLSNLRFSKPCAIGFLLTSPLSGHPAQSDAASPVSEQEKALFSRAVAVVPSTRQLAWQKRELQALVHFGMNTFTGREWGTGSESPSIFNPLALDCVQWVEAARACGAQSVTLVCKHHDGFCLWPSKFTAHSVKASPWKGGSGDVVRELSDACRKAGLKFGVYLSPGDLHDPNYGRNSAKYNDYYCKQLEELLTQYGPICEVFFDGAQMPGKHQVYDFQRYYRLIRQLQPNAVISVRGPDVRWVGNEQGHARESEWSVIPLPVPADQYDWPDKTALDLGSRKSLEGAKYLHWYPAAADVCLRGKWFWSENQDSTVKSLQQLLSIYLQSVGRNAVLQLNLSPDNTGRIPEADMKRLKEFGDSLRGLFTTNLLACTGARVEPTRSEHDGSSTQKLLFPSEQKLAYLVLQEDITKGQRVENFEVAISASTGPAKVFRATTIGYKRILRLGGIPTSELLLRITQARAEPFVTVAAY